MSIVTVITDPSVGGTFLTWSLEWLSGKNFYFYFKNNDWLPLCDDPVKQINAHAFRPNKPTTLDQLHFCYDALRKIPNSGDHFVYFHNLANNTHSYPVDPKIDESAVQLAYDHSQKCLLLNLSVQHPLYHCKQSGRSLHLKWESHECNATFHEQNKDYVDYFFHQDQENWVTNLNLNEVWDQREFLALNFRPFEVPRFNKSLFRGRECLLLTSEDCFFYLDSTIDQVFSYIGRDIDKSRWEHWCKIYKRWQSLHRDRMRFSWYFDEIIQAIIDGIKLDLSQFDLDLYREAALQHTLLYRHNLNLRTYKLEKFIDTCQLHNLLEPNTYHKLAKIY